MLRSGRAERIGAYCLSDSPGDTGRPAWLSAGGCFAYYFLSLRMTPEEQQGTRLHRYAALVSSAAVAGAIVTGIVATGSPAAARQQKFDVRRVEDIRMIHAEVMNQTVGSDWRSPQVTLVLRTPLPESLAAVAQHAVRQRPRILDPATGAPYVYDVTGASTFRVCAVFDTAREAGEDEGGVASRSRPPERPRDREQPDGADGQDPVFDEELRRVVGGDVVEREHGRRHGSQRDAAQDEPAPLRHRGDGLSARRVDVHEISLQGQPGSDVMLPPV